jgi:hypothetical protein
MNAQFTIKLHEDANYRTVNAIADACGGSWAMHDTNEEIGFIYVPLSQIGLLRSLLETDKRVLSYDDNVAELIDESAREVAKAFVDEFGKAYNCATDGDWDAEAFDATPFAKIEDQESVMRWFEKFYADTECVALRKRVAREWNND